MISDAAKVALVAQYVRAGQPRALVFRRVSLRDFVRDNLARRMRGETGSKRLRKKKAATALRFVWALGEVMRPPRPNYAALGRALFPVERLPDATGLAYYPEPASGVQSVGPLP